MSEPLAHWQPWSMAPLDNGEPPAFDEDAARREQRRRQAAAQRQELQRLREQAQAEGHQQGHAEGRQQGYDEGLAQGREAAAEALRQQVEQTLQPLQALCLSFAAALREADGLLAGHLGQVALDLAARLAGEALAVQPAQVEALVRQMLASDPELAGKPRLSLNPDDLPWVESSLGDELHAAGWTLHADPGLLPGGCRVTSKAGELDATRQTRQAMFEGNGQWLLDNRGAAP